MLDDGVVLVPGSLSLIFNLAVSGHANNYIVNNVPRALFDRLTVKFAGEIGLDTDGYSLFNLYEDLLLTECHSSTSSTVSLNAWLINEVCIIYKNTILTEEQIKVHHDFFAEKDTTFTQKINTISATPMALQEDRSRW